MIKAFILTMDITSKKSASKLDYRV
jgi:hypothetical protein